MVVKTNMDSIRTYNIYNRNSIGLSNSMYKVSSAQRINSAADGASDLAISEKMRTRIRSVDQAERNTQNGLNMVKTADGALSNIHDMLSQIREKVINFANDSNGEAERKQITTEVDALVKSIENVALNTSYNGKALLDGTWATNALYFQTSADGDMGTSVNIGSAKTDSEGLNIEDLAETLGTLEDSDTTVKDDVKTILETVDTAIDTLSTLMTNLGATENSLGFTADILANESENLHASDSTNRDLDMAKGMTEFARWNILTQSSQFMLAQASQNPYQVLNLLQQ